MYCPFFLLIIERTEPFEKVFRPCFDRNFRHFSLSILCFLSILSLPVFHFISLFLTFMHKGIINREVQNVTGKGLFYEKNRNDRGRHCRTCHTKYRIDASLANEGFEISYIGSYEGIEKRLIEEQGVPYYGISSGKLRRYFDPKNFSDPFKVLKGYAQSIRLLKKIKPDVVFSKGGFVSVPVVLAAKHCKVPAIIHESDLTPGLANKLAIPSATKVCCNFPETLSYLPKEKAY